MTPKQNQESPETLRILQVDDEIDFQTTTKRMLQSFDPFLHIESTTSPMEALERLKSEIFDCVVSDYQMPSMDGVELAKRIRESSNIPFILYTGKGSEEIAERAFGAGIDDYIRKEMEPAHYQVLVRRIRAAVEKHNAESDLMDFKLGIDRSDEAIFVTDIEGVIKYVNPAFEKIYGYNSLEAVGKTPRILKSGVISQEVYVQFWDTLLAKQVVTGEIINKTKDGRFLTMFSSANPILNEEEKITGFLTIQRDITERTNYVNQLESIYENASSLSQSQTLKEVAKATLDGIEGIFGFKQMSFTEVQSDVIKAVEIRGGNFPPVRTVFPLDSEGIIPKVARTGKTINLSDIRDDPDYFEAVSSTKSELTVPVNVEDEIVAVINIESSEVNAFSSEDQKLVEIFSEHVATAMRHLNQIERVQSSEERYKVLLESSIDAITVITDDERVFWNKRSEDLFGYTGDELGCVDRFGLIHPDDRGIVKDRSEKRRLGQEVPENYTIRILRKDGSTRFVEIFTLDIVYMGKPSLMNIVRDMTQRKQMEEELIYNAMLVDNVSDAIVSTDAHFITKSWNKAAKTMYGWTADEVLGKPLGDILQAEYIHTTREEVIRQLRSGGWVGEAIHRRKDRTPLEVYSSASLLTDSEGKMVGAVSIIQDISDRKQMEEVHERHIAELVKGVQRVSSTVRHDLRGPLQTIVNATYFMEKNPEMVDEMRDLVNSSARARTWGMYIVQASGQ